MSAAIVLQGGLVIDGTGQPAFAADVAVRGVYTAHIRDERDGIVEALQEAFTVARPGRSPLILSHHKCAGVRNCGRFLRRES